VRLFSICQCCEQRILVPSLYRSGYPVTLSDGPPMKAAQKQVGDLISRIRDTPDGESLTLSVKRENKTLDVSIRPQRTTVQLQSIDIFLSPNLCPCFQPCSWARVYLWDSPILHTPGFSLSHVLSATCDCQSFLKLSSRGLWL
jgi:hypothetical protein